MNWNGDQILQNYQRQYAVQVGIVGDALAEAMKSTVGTMGPPRSKAGEPPHIDTQELQETIAVTVDSSNPDFPTAAIGSPVKQARFTEIGTQDMEPRPWCLSTLKNSKPLLTRNLLGR